MTSTMQFTVFYDGSCPLCLREIGFFQRRPSLVPITWVDVSAIDETKGDGGLPVNKCDAMRRFHIRDNAGVLKTGAAAFAALWACYSGFRVLGQVISLPGFVHIAELGYRLFLLIRPFLQALARVLLRHS